MYSDKFTLGWGTDLYRANPTLCPKQLTAGHPAKAAYYLVEKIFEHITKLRPLPHGAKILDPFGGAGTTTVLGTFKGYACTCGEIEPEFVAMMDNIFRYLRENSPMFSWQPQPSVVQADARALPFADNAFDAIVFSPPYADQIHQKSTEATLKALGKKGHEISVQGVLDGYRSTASGQIGGLKIASKSKPKKPARETYPEAMALVYKECFRVAKPGSFCAVITKDCIKNGRKVRVGVATKRAALAAGFNLADLKFAEVCRPVEAPDDLFGYEHETKLFGRVSYFRRQHFKKARNTLLLYEHIFFLKKPVA